MVMYGRVRARCATEMFFGRWLSEHNLEQFLVGVVSCVAASVHLLRTERCSRLLGSRNIYPKLDLFVRKRLRCY